MKKTISELSDGWRLTLLANEDVVKKGIDPRTVEEIEALGALTVPSRVPSNFELDLYAAGLVPDPYYSQAPWEFYKYENRHLWYYTVFESERDADENTFLLFEGLDTVCDIYVNGKFLGHTENMLIAHEFCAKGFVLAGKNEIVVHITPATIYARRYELKPMNRSQQYNMASLPLRKAPYMYGWDIMPRFVSGGIWKPVKLVQKPAERLEQAYLYTTKIDTAKDTASVNAFFEIHTDRDDISELRITVDGVCGDSRFHSEKRPWHTYENQSITIASPRLWYPKNAGEQSLYDVTVRLWRNDTLCDEYKTRVGIRTITLTRTSTTDKDGNGEFVFRVNDKKIFCMGTNWVPLDAFPSRHKDFLPDALAMMDELGCNMVRCWGGNVYENDEFYDFCDEHGILIWQDFTMGCGVYPQNEDFAERLYTEAVSVIKRLRGHAALALWAGDNENDLAYSWNGYRRDPNFNRLTRTVLPAAVREYDFTREFLPSSPYVDSEAYASKQKISEDHLWGPRDYFKGNFYKNSVCHFASETGYHGCPSPKSLERFIAPDRLWPIFGENGRANNDWICHAAAMEPEREDVKVPYVYRIKLMADQVVTLFGAGADSLDTFARQSQISQAEAKKYFIERFRLSKWRRTGIIWWNLIDGWPQISDAIVDQYRCKKLAYHYIKRSQQRLCMMFDEPDNGRLTLYAVNDLTEDKTLCYTVKNISTGEYVCKGEAKVSADSSVAVVSVSEPSEAAFLYIEWETSDGEHGENHFMSKTLNISYEDYMRDIARVGFDEFEGF